MKSWIPGSDFSFRDARVPQRQPSARLQALVRENQNVNAAPPPSKPEDCHCFSSFFTSLDKVLTEIGGNWIGGKDQDVLCTLGYIPIHPVIVAHRDSFDLVVRYYNLDKELLQADQRLFSQFKTTHLQQSIKSCRSHWSVERKQPLWNDRQSFASIPRVASILAVIPATSSSLSSAPMAIKSLWTVWASYNNKHFRTPPRKE